MFDKKTIADINSMKQRVLMRVDFNVPLEDGKVQDDTRIQAALPSINALLKQGAALILISHLGRPAGKPDSQYSLRAVSAHLETRVSAPVFFAGDCLGPLAQAGAAKLQPGEVLLLENTRFHQGEKKNDPAMAKELASLADIFVNDAFGSAHRAHASTVGVADYLPSVAGMLLEKEIRYLGKTLLDPKRPFVAILGGAKISDKIAVIENLLEKADRLLIGGGMANTFLLAKGYQMGDSLVDENSLEIANSLMKQADEKLLLPSDLLIANKFAEDAETRLIPIGDIPDGWRALDIGPQTIENFSNEIEQAASVIWNGPMGVFEMPPFALGTFALAKSLADSNAISIVGGGDSAAAIKQSGLASQITHISTGGGASLEMLAGKTLPGLAALDDKETA